MAVCREIDARAAIHRHMVKISSGFCEANMNERFEVKWFIVMMIYLALFAVKYVSPIGDDYGKGTSIYAVRGMSSSPSSCGRFRAGIGHRRA